MSSGERPLFFRLSEMQGPAPFSDEEMFHLRRRAWEEQGLLITSVDDGRLTGQERSVLNRIGEFLYGKRD